MSRVLLTVIRVKLPLLLSRVDDGVVANSGRYFWNEISSLRLVVVLLPELLSRLRPSVRLQRRHINV